MATTCMVCIKRCSLVQKRRGGRKKKKKKKEKKKKKFSAQPKKSSKARFCIITKKGARGAWRKGGEEDETQHLFCQKLEISSCVDISPITSSAVTDLCPKLAIESMGFNDRVPAWTSRSFHCWRTAPPVATTWIPTTQRISSTLMRLARRAALYEAFITEASRMSRRCFRCTR